MNPTEQQIAQRYLASWIRSIREQRRGRANGVEQRLICVLPFAALSLRSAVGGLQTDVESEFVLRLLETLEDRTRGAAAHGAQNYTNLILLEEDPFGVDRIRPLLQQPNLVERVRETSDLGALASGEIGIVASSLQQALPDLLQLAGGDTHVLYLIAPPAPGDFPLEVARSLRNSPQTDLLIPFPGAHLRREGLLRGSTIADLPPYARRLADGYSALFADPRYEWLPLWRTTARSAGLDSAERTLVERYRDRLVEGTSDVSVQWWPLHDHPPGTGAFHLLLSTGEPGRVLAMNRILYDAEIEGVVAREPACSSWVREEDSGALDLFLPTGSDGSGTARRLRQVNFPALAHAIASQFAGQTVAFREVFRFLVDAHIFPEDVRRALLLLKRDGRALYHTLKAEDEIVFVEGDELTERNAGNRSHQDGSPADLALEAP